MTTGRTAFNRMFGGGGCSKTIDFRAAVVTYGKLIPYTSKEGIVRRTDDIDVSEFPTFTGLTRIITPAEWITEAYVFPHGLGIVQNLTTGEDVFVVNKSTNSYVIDEIINYSMRQKTWTFTIGTAPNEQTITVNAFYALNYV